METHLFFCIRNFFNGFILGDVTGSGKIQVVRKLEIGF